jgi:hypothetical protein
MARMTSALGYSDRINHALAFAAKHHDQQVRRGTRSPYLTQPANVAIILTRYDCPEDVVVAGILYDIVEDFVRAGYPRELLDERVGVKFGDDVLTSLLAVVPRRTDDDGIELTLPERRDDVIDRLAKASHSACWVLAATLLHNAASLLTDLRRTVDPDAIWVRIGAGKDVTVDWYQRVNSRLREVGFVSPIVEELDTVVSQLQLAGVR